MMARMSPEEQLDQVIVQRDNYIEELQAENKRLRDALENLASIKWLCNCSHAIDGRKHSELCALGIIHKALKETE